MGTPSNKVAWRAVLKLFAVSGRRSRAVRAASAVALLRGIDPTAASFSGITNLRFLLFGSRRRMATSSGSTLNSFARVCATFPRASESGARHAPTKASTRDSNATLCCSIMNSLRRQSENGHYIQSNTCCRVFLNSRAKRLVKDAGITYTQIRVQEGPEPGCLRVKLTYESVANFPQEKLN